jgi:NADPH:quinone reductase-like Zn-dependent oxidoreductase
LRLERGKITSGRGVELILDAVGGDSLRKGYRLLAPTGRLGMFGVSSVATNKTGGMAGMLNMLARTPWFQFNPLSLINANKGVFGVNLGHMWEEIERMRGWIDQLTRLWEQGIIKPQIAQTFRFDEAAAAHHFIQDRKNIGKVMLTSE